MWVDQEPADSGQGAFGRALFAGDHENRVRARGQERGRQPGDQERQLGGLDVDKFLQERNRAVARRQGQGARWPADRRKWTAGFATICHPVCRISIARQVGSPRSTKIDEPDAPEPTRTKSASDVPAMLAWAASARIVAASADADGNRPVDS